MQLERLLGPASEGAWIGLSDILTAGTFAWRDGARYKYNMCMVHSTQYTVHSTQYTVTQYTVHSTSARMLQAAIHSVEARTAQPGQR